MKIATLTTLPLLVSGALVPPQQRTAALAESNKAHYQDLHKRQFWDSVGQTISKNLPGLLQWGATNLSWLLKWSESPVNFKSLAPAVDSKAKKIGLRYGPFLLNGANETQAYRPNIQMDPKSTIFLRTLKGIPWNAAILSARTSLNFEDGSDADFNNGIYIHHILIADLGKQTAPFALCPNLHKENNVADWAWGYFMEAIGAGLVQSGNDARGGANLFLPTKGTMKSAFLTNKDDLFGFQAEIVNYHPMNKTVFFNLELEYLEQKPADYLDASTIVISATGCRDPGYRPPQNQKKYNHTSEKFDITNNGFIVNARGHLHDGGTAIELHLNGKMVCQSLPTYGKAPGSPPGTPETIMDMSWCMDSVPIKKGDSLVLKTYYDLEKHPLRQLSGGEKEMPGHGSHGSHGGSGKEGEAKELEADGAQEMGIMTTNFAWEIPADAKKPVTGEQVAKTQPASGASDGSFLSSLFGGSKPETPTGTTKSSPSPSPSSTGSSWWQNLFGGSSSTTPSPTPTADKTKAAATPSPTPTSSCNWFTSIFGCSEPSPVPTPASTVAPWPGATQMNAPAAAPKPADKPMDSKPMAGHSHG